MIDVELPPGPAAGALARGFAACLASVTEVPVTDLPLPDEDLAHALGAWRSWLAEHGSGLVPIADPVRFQWAGWWIAVVEDPSGPAGGGRPTGRRWPCWRSARRRASCSARRRPRCWVGPPRTCASARPTPSPPSIRCCTGGRPTPDLRGTVEGLAVAPAAEAPMQLLEVAQARAGRGLDGDRYAAGAGTFSSRAGRRPGYDLTLIAAEVLDEMAAAGQTLDFAGTRRNVLTRGIDVNALVGRRFRIGDVLCEGRRLCEPCVHLDRLSGPGILRPLIHRGGLRVDVLTDGEIRLGAPVLSV